AVEKFKSNPSIVKRKITGNPSSTCTFRFREVTLTEVEDLVINLDCTKKAGGPISAKLLKLSSNVVCPVIRDSINQCFRTGRFPNCLKKGEIIPVPKKEVCSQYVGDYRPISILPTVSKLFEKSMANMLSEIFDSKFSDLLCGFRKKHSTQHALVNLVNSWQKSLDEGKVVGTVLMDLQKLMTVSHMTF
ncbi:MAG: reverse transcriptase domain-containing protein, partial [Pseudomonadota bacterium]